MQKKKFSCPCCYSEGMNIFHKLENVPVNSVLNQKARDQAVSFPRGDITLGFCDHCGFVSNVAFDPALLEYSEEYESTQSYSSTYSAFARQQAKQIIERHHLHGTVQDLQPGGPIYFCGYRYQSGSEETV